MEYHLGIPFSRHTICHGIYAISQSPHSIMKNCSTSVANYSKFLLLFPLLVFVYFIKHQQFTSAFTESFCDFQDRILTKTYLIQHLFTIHFKILFDVLPKKKNNIHDYPEATFSI